MYSFYVERKGEKLGEKTKKNLQNLNAIFTHKLQHFKAAVIH